MSAWKSLLRGDATGWLLEESDPSVRYFALRWLCDRPEKSAEVARARQAIARSAPVRRIHKDQRPEGYWGADRSPDKGTRGPLMLLLWLGAPVDKQIRSAIDYRTNGCLLPSGAYAVKWKGHRFLAPCHGAEMLALMLRYGYAGDPRTAKLLDWLLSLQEPDGVMPCVSKRHHYACMWATADMLRAFRELPPRWETARVKQARQRAVELFLDSHICRYHTRRADPRWFLFGFPLAFTSDILDVLESVAPYVSPADARIKEPLEVILGKQDKQGRWACEKNPQGASGGKWMERYIALEEIGTPSKWVTLHALRTLKLLYASA